MEIKVQFIESSSEKNGNKKSNYVDWEVGVYEVISRI